MRKGTIDPSDFQGTTITLTNPGTVGTYMSLPRLMTGQGAIIATGAIGYPTEYHAWSPRALSSLGLSQVMTISCTYDHRIIQGAETGHFLGRVKELLMGQDGFYEQIFRGPEGAAVSDPAGRWTTARPPSALRRSARISKSRSACFSSSTCTACAGT